MGQQRRRSQGVYKTINKIPLTRFVVFDKIALVFLFRSLKYTSNAYLNKEKSFSHLTEPQQCYRILHKAVLKSIKMLIFINNSINKKFSK